MFVVEDEKRELDSGSNLESSCIPLTPSRSVSREGGRLFKLQERAKVQTFYSLFDFYQDNSATIAKAT